jgi:hypothetical protein
LGGEVRLIRCQDCSLNWSQLWWVGASKALHPGCDLARKVGRHQDNSVSVDFHQATEKRFLRTVFQAIASGRSKKRENVLKELTGEI